MTDWDLRVSLFHQHEKKLSDHWNPLKWKNIPSIGMTCLPPFWISIVNRALKVCIQNKTENWRYSIAKEKSEELFKVFHKTFVQISVLIFEAAFTDGMYARRIENNLNTHIHLLENIIGPIINQILTIIRCGHRSFKSFQFSWKRICLRCFIDEAYRN